MRKHLFSILLILGTAALLAGEAASQEKKEKKKDGPPLGVMLPPFVLDKLKLSEAQEQKVRTLGSTIQIRLGKVLTPQQMQQLDTILKEGPGAKDGKGQMPKGPKRPPGLVIPPFAEGRLQLTAAQQRQIAQLERYARAELFKILTPAQQRLFAELQRRGPGDGPGGPGQSPKDRLPPEAAPPPSPAPEKGASSAGIQWFATWSSGLQEAERSGRPILLVAGAPHCAGVSGTW